MPRIDKKEVRKLILNKYGGRCAYCGVDITMSTLSIDHIKPKKRHIDGYGDGRTEEKGKDEITNYNPSCKSCNSSKSDFSLEDWRHQILKKHFVLLKSSSQYSLLNRMCLIEYKPDNFKFFFERQEQITTEQ